MVLKTASGKESVTVPAGSDVPVRLRMPADATGEVNFYTIEPSDKARDIGDANLVDGVAVYNGPASQLPVGKNTLRAYHRGNKL